MLLSGLSGCDAALNAIYRQLRSIAGGGTRAPQLPGNGFMKTRFVFRFLTGRTRTLFLP